jgi:hypothetical protein
MSFDEDIAKAKAMRPRKLTEAMLTRIREVEMLRRSIPPRKQLAKELGLSKRTVDEVASNCNEITVRCGTSTRLQEALVELGLAKP